MTRVLGRLTGKLFAAFLAVAFVGVAIAGWLVDRNVRHNSFEQVRQRLDAETLMLGQMTASALFGELDPGDTSLDESVSALARAVHTDLSVLTPRGAVVVTSGDPDMKAGEDDHDAPEIVAAGATGTGVVVRPSGAGERLYVARSIVRDGRLLGFARTSIPMDAVRAETAAVRARMAYGALVAAAVALVLGLFVSVRIVRPVTALAAGARRIGEGKYGERVDVSSSDELGELAVAFNEMSRGLRATVDQLDHRNRDMRTVLDYVGEGLITVRKDGTMSTEKSAIVDQWFGSASASLPFWDYVATSGSTASRRLRLHWQQLVEGVLPMGVSIDQMPKRIESRDRLFELEYQPIFAGEELEAVLVVLRDVTTREQARRAEADQREVLLVFECVMRDKSGFLEFLAEADRLVVEVCGAARPTPEVLKRALHTLKGNAAVFGILSVAEMCHELESRLEDVPGDLDAASRGALEVRWQDFTRRMRDLLGEREALSIELQDDEYEAVLNAVLNGAPRAEIAEMISEWKQQRVDLRLEHFAVQLRSLAHRLDKGKVIVRVECDAKLRVGRDAMAPFWSAFVHVVRNAADHGIVRASKPGGAASTVRLTAGRSGPWLVVEVADDGPGVDWGRVADRAAARGLPHNRHEDLVEAIFSENFTTQRSATATSGRGVGLGVVRRACRALGGRVEVSSEPGKGTTFRFELPLDAVSRKTPVRVPTLSRPPPG